MHSSILKLARGVPNAALSSFSAPLRQCSSVAGLFNDQPPQHYANDGNEPEQRGQFGNVPEQRGQFGNEPEQRGQFASTPQRRFINRGVNRVELLGGVGGPPVVKQTAQGSAFASFNLYTNVDRRLNNGGTMSSTEVHNVIAFGGMARYVEKNIERGTRVYMTGRLHYTGGAMNADGSRTPRICSVNLEAIYPLSKSGAVFNAGGSSGGGNSFGGGGSSGGSSFSACLGLNLSSQLNVPFSACIIERQDEFGHQIFAGDSDIRAVAFGHQAAAGDKHKLPSDIPPPSPLSSDTLAAAQGWVSRILTGPASGDERKQSHSSMLSVGEYIYELQTHDAVGGDRDKYLDAYKKYATEVQAATPGATLFGSWNVLFGNQDQVVNLWRYQNGYADLDSHIRALQTNVSMKSAEVDYAKLCRRRRTVITKPFSYWGEPRAREPSHVYDLRSYVLKPGSMIEWGNAWAKGITHRREFNQDVAGFFSQVGQLYMVFHIWAYPSMVGRNTTRQLTWAKPGWDTTVEYTVPLIKKMQSRILVPTELSLLK
uniref:t-SNARE coiled-coil homology domain-containing protein n=1 Tax=Globodera rostochiensis TaxID=31243 RepID=A0A914GZE5_GLORO